MNQPPLHDKVAIITGSAQGIGLATAQVIAERGGHSVLVDINEEKLEKALASVKAVDPEAASFVMDVSRKGQWKDVVDRVYEAYGSVDILVNNAAVSSVMKFEDITEEAWDSLFAVNVKGVLFGCQTVSPYMRRQRAGRIINLASQAGKSGGLLIGAHYSASKAAVICMTKTFAAALAPDNITVNAVAPGIIDTDLLKGIPGIENFFSRIPLGNKPGRAVEVANAIAFLSSEDAGYITGEILDVNGGQLMD